MMFRRVLTRKVMVLLISVMLGASLPVLVRTATAADGSAIPVPGVPVDETLFAPLVSPLLDPVIVVGEWSRNWFLGTTYHLTLPPSNMTAVEGRSAAIASVDERLRQLIQDDPNNPGVGADWSHWRYTFYNGTELPSGIVNYSLYIQVHVNSFSKRVSGYYEDVSEEFSALHRNVFPVPSETLIDALGAQVAAYEYLENGGYTLPVHSRLLDVRPEVGSYHSGPDEPANWTRPIYVVEFGLEKGSVFPPADSSGPVLYIDAATGRVFRFEYHALDIPDIGAENALDIVEPAIAEQCALRYLEGYSELDSVVLLRLQRSSGSWWDLIPAYAFRYHGDEEFMVNAHNGERFYPEPYFSGGYGVRQTTYGNALLILLVSAALASSCYILVAKHLTKPSV